MTQENIGLVYLARARHPATTDPKLDLTRALQHLDQALSVFEPEHMPMRHQRLKSIRVVLAALAASGE